jgi:uncharacterized repeat protein (TIGR03803 family)
MQSRRVCHLNFFNPNKFVVVVAVAMASLAFLSGSTGAQAQAFSVLYNFGTHSGDPLFPQYAGIIAQGRDGDLYSTTRYGGSGTGAVFRITPSGTLSVIYNNRHGGGPCSGLTLSTDGNFYGTTFAGGGSEGGRIFKVAPDGSFKVLNGFNWSNGKYPYAPPVQGTDGHFYGTTSEGGNLTECQSVGCGTIYKITSSGKLTVLHVFDGTDGQFPLAPLVQGTDGSFYGTTAGGGTNGHGTVFTITAAGNLTVLYKFDGIHGQGPIGPLVQGSDGNFYGTTGGGGANGVGVVFRLTPKGAITLLHQFNGTDGQAPYAGLVQATDGNFYGATASGGSIGGGTIFRVSGKGSFSTLYNFNNSDSTNPEVTLFQHTNGILYGDTFQGGTGKGCSTSGCGTFFSLSVGLPPFVSLLSTSGKIGKTVEILGQGFTGTTGVSFNGTAANFQVVSDTYLTATVPNGATTGFVTVTTPGGTLTSNKKFRVRAQVR